MNIEGVELLKETLIAQKPYETIYLVGLVASIIFMFIFGVFLFHETHHSFKSLWSGAIIFCIATTILFSIKLIENKDKPKYINRYVILVNEQELVAKEIYENYEVIEIDENIWTIEDKKED